jgi:hypothetical protein
MNATMPLISAPTASPFQSPLINGEVYTHDLAGAVTVIAHSDDWLAIGLGNALRLYRLKNFNWHHQHRQIDLGMTPRYLLFGGMDSHYLIAINEANHYEVWDRVSAKLQTVGKFTQHISATQYQIINQQYLLATSDSTLRLYALKQLVPPGSDILSYPLEFRPEPIAQVTVGGDLCAVVFHSPSQTILCASQSSQMLTLTAIAAADGQLVPLPTGKTYPLQFVGLSCTENQLLLQALSLDGPLRLMLFDLPDLHLCGVQEKSLAYQGKTVLCPVQPWAMTDLGSGLLLWDTRLESPLGWIPFPTPNPAAAIAWLNHGKFLFIHGPIAEMWSFESNELPFISRYTPPTTAVLKNFQRWMQLQRQCPGIAVCLGETGTGKTAILRAYSDLNFADTLYLETPTDATLVDLRARLWQYLRPEFGQIILDQAERLPSELIAEIIQITQQRQISVILVTTMMPDVEVPIYRDFPLQETVDWQKISAFFAPIEQRQRLYLQQVKPVLERTARKQLAQSRC